MYEFLAPWGLLGPALSAFLAYSLSNRARRGRQMQDFENDDLPATVSLATRTLSRPAS